MFYTDTLFSKTKSLKGNTCAQIYSNGKGFTWVEPMKSKVEAGKTLKKFIQDVGIPNALTTDGSLEQTGINTEFQKLIRKYHIKEHQLEAETQKLNSSEDDVLETTRRWKQRIIKRRFPQRVWEFALV